MQQSQCVLRAFELLIVCACSCSRAPPLSRTFGARGVRLSQWPSCSSAAERSTIARRLLRRDDLFVALAAVRTAHRCRRPVATSASLLWQSRTCPSSFHRSARVHFFVLCTVYRLFSVLVLRSSLELIYIRVLYIFY